MTLLVAVISLIAVAIIGVLVDWLLKSILPGNPRSRPRIIVFGLVAIIALGILAAWFSSGTWPSPTPTSETSIVIHVFDRDSEISISNAKVLLFSDGNRLVGVTDNTGTSKFQIPFLDATGEIDLVVETDNYAIERLNDIQPRDKKIDIPLNQREGSNANVIFLVTDENAAAVPRAEVVLFVEGDVRSQITDSNGIVIFTIAFLGDKIDAKVRVEASGYEPGDQSLTLSPNKVQGIRLSPDSGFQPVSVFTPETPTPTNTSTPTNTPSPIPNVTLTPTSTAIPTNTPIPIPTPLGGGGHIAFVSNRNGRDDIYVFNTDGSQTNLTNNPTTDDWATTWSPDGTRIAFASRRDDTEQAENREIYIMNANGSGQKNLTRNPAHDSQPAWSPDGKWIAFTSDRTGNLEIYLMDSDGNQLNQLTNNGATDAHPAWSSDGELIVFVSNREGNEEIYKMNSDGNGIVRLTYDSNRDLFPVWSPNNEQIVFQTNRDGNWEIYVMNTQGDQSTNLTNNPADDQWPFWSPDSTLIVFGSNRDGNNEMYLMSIAGNEVTRLTDNPANDIWFSWSPQ